jgi:coenzyme PQQ precursor peptide PqqA
MQAACSRRISQIKFAPWLEMRDILAHFCDGARVALGPMAPRVPIRRTTMKQAWSKPPVTEQEVGLEVTSYLPAEID